MGKDINKSEVTVNDIEKKLQEVRKQQARMCIQELDKAITLILAKYKCQLDISVVLKAGQVIPRLGVISKNL